MATNVGVKYFMQIMEAEDLSSSSLSSQKSRQGRKESGGLFLVSDGRVRSWSGISLSKDEELKMKVEGIANKNFESDIEEELQVRGNMCSLA